MGKRAGDKAEEIFKKIDTDGSGGISLEELKAHLPPHRKGTGDSERPDHRGKHGGNNDQPALEVE